MIQMCERDYKRLLEGRNALGAALAALVNAPDVATSELAPRSEVLEHARAVLAEYGAHQAFVLEST
ncbi:hypothetical protein A9Y76_27065 (plasmid) [Ralstonia insidiosa]|uniref:Uncharacterized protein n=1 Tax=Ralstonia insidiosa TaxID=190721 RepID=A0A192A8G0_9RALS|nr:hypothetical protein A9Y76_27065 [Ralstonia insidiosa]KMW44910.1 hypothetical protein AC240_23200 [Ralstonia sp. MD27]MBA9869540.1 hypothetical protein [Ralstonia insidiosa]MBA9913750.1 hypothetical protein [Ralstonia insidiosa]MBA9952537.1 hypothetical protein [Ralstonia insidiosa]